ncbi:DUF302 domain-containing protein [Thiolapillus sp.]
MYHFSTRIQGDFAEVEKNVIEALKAEGFGVLTEIDIKSTLKEKLDVDYRPYRILGACNPPLANQALQAEPDIGLLLPCNVVVREDEDGSIVVSFMDPAAVLTLVDKPKVAELAGQVRDKLQRVMAAVAG